MAVPTLKLAIHPVAGDTWSVKAEFALLAVLLIISMRGANAAPSGPTTPSHTRAVAVRPPVSPQWSTADKIALVNAVATSGYFLATIVLILLMARGNRIATQAAAQSSEFSRLALEQTRRSNELTQQSVEAASVSARVAQQQFDSQLLDRYIPIQSALSAAAANAQAAMIFPEKIPYTILPKEFAQAMGLAASLGPSLHLTFQMASIMLQTAQAHRDNLSQSVQKLQPADPILHGLRELVNLHCSSAKLLLEAAVNEIAPTVERLRASTGRADLTLHDLDATKL